MSDTYEFKLRLAGDHRDWEAISPHSTFKLEGRAAAASFALGLAEGNQDVEEVRFNSQGSQQGHYVSPSLVGAY